MQPLAADYLIALAHQFAFVCAFLGGFAATFMATLLTVHSKRRVAGWTIGSSAFAAVAFIVGAVASSMLIVVLHPHAPNNINGQAVAPVARLASSLGFGIGVYSLLIAVGLSGWMRSRAVGYVTSTVSALGILAISWAFAG